MKSHICCSNITRETDQIHVFGCGHFSYDALFLDAGGRDAYAESCKRRVEVQGEMFYIMLLGSGHEARPEIGNIFHGESAR